MATAALPQLTSAGFQLETTPACFGMLRASADCIDDTAVLVQRLHDDGYLFLPGYLAREQVLAARQSTLDKLAVAGALHPNYPVLDGAARGMVAGGR
jgi:hypothetical protein